MSAPSMSPSLDAADEPLVGCLVCQACSYPIVCSQDDLIPQRWPDTLKEAVFAYELDLLDTQDVWCYSATNPSGVRFDVVRARKCNIALEGAPPCAEYSWFPGQAWRMAACVSCHTHLGWHFQPAPPSDTAGGEVVTPTRESRVGSKRSRVASPPSGTSPPQGELASGELLHDTAAAATTSAAATAAATEAALPSARCAAQEEEDTSQHFTGLIVTRLREKRVTRTQLEQMMANRRNPTNSLHFSQRLLSTITHMLRSEVRDPTTLRRRAMAQLLNTFASLGGGAGHEDEQGGTASALRAATAAEDEEEDGTEARDQAADVALAAAAGQQLTEQGAQAEAEANVELVSSADDAEMDADLETILSSVLLMLERRAGQGENAARTALSLMASMPLPGRHNRGARVEEEEEEEEEEDADERAAGGGGGGGGDAEGVVFDQGGASQLDDTNTDATPAEHGAH